MRILGSLPQTELNAKNSNAAQSKSDLSMFDFSDRLTKLARHISSAVTPSPDLARENAYVSRAVKPRSPSNRRQRHAESSLCHLPERTRLVPSATHDDQQLRSCSFL